jgi:hypothetical protein
VCALLDRGGDNSSFLRSVVFCVAHYVVGKC